jgi:tetratricopeptide (TPR) repeat protein
VNNLDIVDIIESGEELLEKGKVGQAHNKFLEALKIVPDDPQMHNRLGMFEMARNNPEKAKKYYQEACKLAPEVSRYHMRLGDSLQRLSKYEGAIQSYSRSLELEPKNAPAWNNRGFANFNIDRWDEALRCYDESMRSDPTYAVAWYNYGYTLQLSGRLNESKDFYQKAVDLDPTDKIAWNNLANVHYNQGQYERSIEIYKKSLKLDSEYVIAVNNIGNALDHLHRYQESIPYHERAIELDSTFHYAWMAKGRALTKLNRAEEGLEFIETSIELNSEDPDYYEALAYCYIELNLLDKARTILNQGLALDGQHVPCWIALGDVNAHKNPLQSLQCYDEAVRAQDVLSRNRMRDLDWIEKGRILHKAGVMHEGIRQYNNAINVASSTSRPYFKMAEILLRDDLYEDAKEVVKKGLAVDPDSITGYALLIQSLSSLEINADIDNLISKSRNSQRLRSLLGSKLVDINPSKALEILDKNIYEDIMNRIACFKNLNENEKALNLSKFAITIKPDDVNSWIAAGWSSYDLEKYEEANNFFESALGCDRLCPDALFGKASVMKIKGKDYSHYQKALAEIDAQLVI